MNKTIRERGSERENSTAIDSTTAIADDDDATAAAIIGAIIVITGFCCRTKINSRHKGRDFLERRREKSDSKIHFANAVVVVLVPRCINSSTRN